MIGDKLTKVTKRVRRVILLAAVLSDREVLLDKDPKGDVEVEGMSVTVVEELLLNSNPGLVGNATTLVCDVLQLDGDSSEDPGEDYTIHLMP